MTKPEFPNSDASSNPQSSRSQSEDGAAQEKAQYPTFEWTSTPHKSGELPDKKGSNLELFPMPEMTVSSDDAPQKVPPEAPFPKRTKLQQPFPWENSAPSADATADAQNASESNAEPVGDRTPDLSSPAVSSETSAAIPPSEVHDTGQSEVVASTHSLNQDSSEQSERDNAILEEKDTAAAKQETPKADHPVLMSIKRWGAAVTSNPVVQRITGFTGWPWAIALGVSGTTTVTAFAWLAGLPPVPNCKIPSSAWSASGRLYCADQAARKKEPQALASALEMVGDWDKDDPMYEQVNKLSDDWSRSILDVAQRELDEGKLNDAIKLAEKVPKSSSYYDESRATIKSWQSNWKEGEKILAKARDAIQEQDWAVATDQLRQLVQLGGEHWQRRADKLISEMTIEQDAFRQLNVANDRAGYGTVSDIESAILLATKIDAKRLARKKLVSYVDRWSEKLVDLADYYYEIGDYETAIEAAKAVPPGSKVRKDAIAYLQASLAQAASEKDNAFGYMRAVAHVSQVPEEAEVLDIAQEDIEDWESQVQSWAQMEFAKLFTRFDQQAGYEIAIDHAALIDVENPNRIKAQSLIAQWDKQLNSVSDRQTIARAAQLAKKTNLASLQAAIAEARRVEIESPLRIRAQTLIAEWEGSIEKREDQPILDKANALAKQGDLYAAIEKAEEIESNRALYDDAQDAIDGWTSKIQVAEDDPILDAAAALANQGRYSEAIAKASEVGYGRALYYEAQDLIGRWIAERNRIEAARRPPEPEPYQEEQYFEPEDQYFEPQSAPPDRVEEPYYPPQDDYVDSASGAGLSGGPGGF